MTYFADYLNSITSTEKTEVETALRLRVFGDTSIVIKPNGDGRAGILNWKHDDSLGGYIIHFTAGPNSAGSLIALGTDEGSAGGMLISAKNSGGAGITLNQNPGATIGEYIQSYASSPALQIDSYVNSGGVRLQAKTGQGFADGVSTSGSTTFTSATASFTASDVGQSITQLTNVGSSSPTGCIPSGATITSVTNSTTVVLSAASTAAGTGVRFRVAGRAVPSTQNFLRLIDADGSTVRGTITYSLFDWKTPMRVQTNDVASIAFIAKAAASQTADIFNVQNSGGTALFRIQSSGRITASYSSFMSNAGLTTQPAMQLSGYSATLPIAQFSQENSSSTGDFFQYLNYDNSVAGRVNYGGYVMTRKTTAPAAGDFVNSEMTFWYDEANAKFKITAKNSAGTVVSGEVALA